MSNYTTGLVLSGGAAKGYGHLGALQALYEAGFVFDVVSGSSVGSIIGALLAEGHEPAAIVEIFNKEKNFNLLKFKFSATGLLKQDGLKSALERHLKARSIEELPKPLIVCATELNTGRARYFSSGPLIDTLLASSCIPLLFAPVRLGDYWFVDGGLTDNLPATPLNGQCQQLVGININPIAPVEGVNGFMETVERVLNIAIHNNVAKSIPMIDLYLEPRKMQEYHLFSLDKGKEMYQLCYEFARQLLQERGLLAATAQ
jgi:NTE family protein